MVNRLYQGHRVPHDATREDRPLIQFSAKCALQGGRRRGGLIIFPGGPLISLFRAIGNTPHSQLEHVEALTFAINKDNGFAH